jgi:acid phosphatase (class A)
MIKFSLFIAFLISAVTTVSAQGNSYSEPSKRAAKPATDHYKTIGSLSPKPDPVYAWMDTIAYPAKEVGTGTLGATMMRTAYLIEDVPSLLNIQPPPANSSEQTRAELKFLLGLQEKRTPEEITRYQTLAGFFHSPNNFNPLDPDYDRNFRSLFHIGSPLGEWYNYKNLPLTAKFLSNAYRDATYYFYNLKVKINRPRPYMLEPQLKYLERPPHQSYPSGHSTASYVNAYILMEIAPELGDEFLKMAAEMAYSREVLGVHYPSDSEMGRILARNLVNEFFKKEKFQKDFEAAKKEILEYKKKAGTIQLKSETNQAAKISSVCGPACSSSCTSTCCK